jgi:hypothetical protein
MTNKKLTDAYIQEVVNASKLLSKLLESPETYVEEFKLKRSQEEYLRAILMLLYKINVIVAGHSSGLFISRKQSDLYALYGAVEVVGILVFNLYDELTYNERYELSPHNQVVLGKLRSRVNNLLDLIKDFV